MQGRAWDVSSKGWDLHSGFATYQLHNVEEIIQVLSSSVFLSQGCWVNCSNVFESAQYTTTYK